jgi:hypothetical protein
MLIYQAVEEASEADRGHLEHWSIRVDEVANGDGRVGAGDLHADQPVRRSGWLPGHRLSHRRVVDHKDRLVDSFRRRVPELADDLVGGSAAEVHKSDVHGTPGDTDLRQLPGECV